MLSGRRRELEAILERVLNTALNRVLALDRAAVARLARLEGRTLAINVRELEWCAHAVVREGRLLISRERDAAVDVTIRGRLTDFVALARANRRGEALGAGRVEILGDLAVAQDVQALLAELDLDWDEGLARYLGDVAAHRVTRTVRGVLGFGRRSVERIEQDAAEYLRHELMIVLVRTDLEEFGRAVFQLDDAVDRLEARLERLATRRQGQ